MGLLIHAEVTNKRVGNTADDDIRFSDMLLHNEEAPFPTPRLLFLCVRFMLFLFHRAVALYATNTARPRTTQVSGHCQI